MKKRLIALTLAIMLICSVAIPASAATGSISRMVSGYYLESNDVCNVDSFYCVLTYDNSSVPIRTDVTPYYLIPGVGVSKGTTLPGPTGYMAVSHSRTVVNPLKSIQCLYYVNNSQITTLSILALQI